MIWRFVEASKATAKAKYLYQKGKGNPETNVLMPDAFQYLESMDPTQQKKYLQALCKWVVEYSMDKLKYNYYPDPIPPPEAGGVYALRYASHGGKHFSFCWEEHFYPAKTPYNRQLLIMKMPYVDLLKSFSILQEAEKRKIPLKDVNSFPDWNVFMKYAGDLDKKYKLSKDTIDAEWVKKVESVLSGHRDEFEVVYRNKKVVVVKIPDFDTGYNLSELLTGGEAHWCVLRDGNYWRDYADDGFSFYVIINLLPDFMEDRLYIADGSQTNPEVWNWEDETLGMDESVKELKRFGIPGSVLKPFKSDPGDYDGYRHGDEDEAPTVWALGSFLDDYDISYTYPFGVKIESRYVNEKVMKKMCDRLEEVMQRQLENIDGGTGHSYAATFMSLLPGPHGGDTVNSEDEFRDYLRNTLEDQLGDTVGVELLPPVGMEGHPGVNISKDIKEEWTRFLYEAFTNSNSGEPGLINFSLAWLRSMGVDVSGKESDILAGVYHKKLESFFHKLGVKLRVISHKLPDEVFFTTDLDFGPSGFYAFSGNYVDRDWDQLMLAEFLLEFVPKRLKIPLKPKTDHLDLEDILAQIMDYLINDAK